MSEVPHYDFRWQQGEDGEIYIIYKFGLPPAPIDLTGYSLRMDIKAAGTVGPVYTVNSADDDAETEDEVTLGEDGLIEILVPRVASLPGGPLANKIEQTLTFDIFLRNPENRQKKILTGTVYFDPSNTLWV
jgi:hypothetical protein